MKILALVPARGGSKRLPGKNIRLLGQKPLITWSIDIVKGIPEISHVLVSTDSPEIAQIARNAGALVPWLRPSELATDKSKSVDVAVHALDWYEFKYGTINGVLLLQPTSPFRSRETVLRGIRLFMDKKFHPIVGVSRSHTHPTWIFKIEKEYLSPFIVDCDISLPSQYLSPAYIINGSFYLVSPSQLRTKRSFITERTIPLIISSEREALDIDTQWDWRIAEYIVEELKSESSLWPQNI